jgi:NADH:ubiquinone oxidoreductase subunit F (NADH-binding)
LRVEVVRSEKLVAEVRDSSGTRGRGAYGIGSHYKVMVTEDRRFYVCCSYSGPQDYVIQSDCHSYL